MGINEVIFAGMRIKGLWAFLHTLAMFATAALLAALVLLGSGCAVTAPSALGPAPTQIAALSDELAWQPWILHSSKRKTVYLRRLSEGRPIIQANAAAAASGLMHRLNVDVSESTQLAWRWKVDALIPGADMSERHADDSPVRIVLAFDGDKSALPGRDQAFFERMKLFTGQDFPYATLMYVWSNQKALETVITNPHTSRVRKIVASSGSGELLRWSSFSRNLAQDFARAYGEKPGKLIGIAILTDTDNTGEKATGFYGDIRLQ